MRAAVLSGPGPVENLTVHDLPIPEPRPGWVRIRVRGFGLNRSELHTRLGLSEDVTFPRVLGIEAVGTVDAAPGSDLRPGQQVAAVLGGMGRRFDGGYAEYTLVPRGSVIPFESTLPWDVLAAIPETLQTAYGSLSIGLDLQPGQTVLIRGGTSALGFAVAALAKQVGATVLATTRQPDRLDELDRRGVDVPLLDDGRVAPQVHQALGTGVDAALELIGTPTLPDTLRAARVHGVVCFAGMLSNQWIVPEFYPIDYIPRGVRLTSYAGGAADLPPTVLQHFLDLIASGEFELGPVTAYQLEDIRQAHADLEANKVAGKLVGLTEETP
jgi:NADPH:quinone reductase-like Zn-dependent oxidoreductase